MAMLLRTHCIEREERERVREGTVRGEERKMVCVCVYE